VNGQYSIYDMPHNGEKKPYGYSFQRYIGQRVKMKNHGDPEEYAVYGKIVEIGPYYTIITDGKRLYAGTRYNLSPVEGEAN